MNRIIAVILALTITVCFAGCGKKETGYGESGQTAFLNQPGANAPVIYSVDINSSNFFDYFEYHEFHSATKEDDGTTSSVSILYGFKLKDGYWADTSGEYLNTLKVNFKATGVVNSGHYKIDYNTLEYTGTTDNVQMVDVEDSLEFWAKGGRTEIYPYGVYNSIYVIYLENFAVTDVSGTIYLTNIAPETPEDEELN